MRRKWIPAVAASLALAAAVPAYADEIPEETRVSSVSTEEASSDENAAEEVSADASSAEMNDAQPESNEAVSEEADAAEASEETNEIAEEQDTDSVTQQVIDGRKYMVKADGTHLTGWYEMQPYGWLYLDPNEDGAAATGVRSVILQNGKSAACLFDSNGIWRNVSGTPVVDGAKYWIKADGTLGTGSLNLGNWKMYFDPATYQAYTDADGVVDINGRKYLYNKDGVMQTFAGTTIVNGGKYWFSDEGYLKCGWLDLGKYGKLYFDPTTYQAATGITNINGKYYLFDANGVLKTAGTPVVNGAKYYVKGDNTLASGWAQLGSYRMHFNEESFAADTGLAEVNGKKYLFNKDGVMYFAPNSTTVVDGAKYWFASDSSLKTGWLTLGTSSMYFDPVTCQAAVGVVTIDGKTCLFDANGVQITGNGLFVVNGKKYYFVNGEVVTGYVTIGNWKMYFDPQTGAAATGIVTIDGKRCLFDANGVQVTGNGLFVSNGKKYYFVNGEVVTGLVTIGNWTMYFDPQTGAAATGLTVIDGKTYYFDSNGVRSSGRQYVNGKTYYFDSNGNLYKNQWIVFNGEKIYVDGNGTGLTDRSAEYPGPYVIRVDRSNCVVTVYAQDSSGNYSIPVRAMTCSVGLPGTETAAGTYTVGSKYRIKELMGPSWGQYASAVAGQSGVYFHSVATSSASNPYYTVPAGEYNKLGSPASHGCIRLCVRDAKWIYEHCSSGTTIIIGDNMGMPLGKPSMPKISSSVDPTDPAV